MLVGDDDDAVLLDCITSIVCIIYDNMQNNNGQRPSTASGDLDRHLSIGCKVLYSRWTVGGVYPGVHPPEINDIYMIVYK